jgi:dihydrofolate synthase/folylpolyglutamate synthase
LASWPPAGGPSLCAYRGTNGKGSTTSLIAAALSASGLRTAKFISPYVLDFRERFQIDGRMISPDELAECCTEVRRFADSLDREGCGPTEIELITAIAVL